MLLVGLSGHRGEVLAAERWGAAEERMPVPPAPAGSHDALLHDAIGAPAVLDFGADRRGPWLSALAGQRAIGVVHEPGSARAGLVPTVMGRRYDALLWFEETSPTRPLHHEAPPIEPELETAPSGM